MTRLSGREIEVAAPGGVVTIKRDENGIPHVKARGYRDLLFALGWVHAYDRFLAMDLTRIIGRGSASEKLDGSPEFVEVDRHFRRYRLYSDALDESKKLKGETKDLIESYCAGVNAVTAKRRPFEFRLVKHRPDPWTPADSMVITRMMELVDITETQGFMEKFIIQMIKSGVPFERIRELCPYIGDEPSPEFMEVIRRVNLAEPIVPPTVGWSAVPRLESSNNWAVAGSRTASGKPIFCGDPHLDSARLPAIWQEVALACDEFHFVGATVPGVPACALGRTGTLAWAPTYGCMDASDYFIEEVKDGKYRRGDEWHDFVVREEKLHVKGKEPVSLSFYETVHGVLETEPASDGYYLSYALTSERTGSTDAENMLKLPLARTVSEAMGYFAALDFGAFNWVMADCEGNIGHQMSGSVPVRPEGASGLLPLPGWDERFDWKGLRDRKDNPSLLNPAEGYFCTANNDVNDLGAVPTITLPMADNRARRIAGMLAARTDHTVESMKAMHYDLYSNQAADFMDVIRPLLPDTPNGRLLEEWDCSYGADRPEPMLFESVYRQLVTTVFGEGGLGEQVTGYLIEETIIPYIFYGNFDRVLLGGESAWFGGKPRDELFRAAVEKGLDVEAVRYGDTRKVVMKNLFFGGRLPRFLGFDHGPVEIAGSRSTITQGQIFTSAGRLATFSPTYKLITDFAEERIHSLLAGGPSDRRFSRWYKSGIDDWLNGRYHTLEP